ncbi:DUF4190 domain-containing protein [Falsarthrobacter nasiphocae]|uniref:DUF4190 domain-containing protein n=1 Tax=Falsarthrobacter nasiphocae TaxID=189863 RepID=A0AAE3YHF8_9MICC|nr:DUF4190 domain-containing protein [Falsarthrobacter nasiphocae]MDR6892003.1 hypothetical protein [Falsarthrobacter nasiphocae]
MTENTNPERSGPPSSEVPRHQEPYGAPGHGPYGQGPSPYGQADAPYGQGAPQYGPYGQQPAPNYNYSRPPYQAPHNDSKGLSVTSLVLGILSIMGGLLFFVPQVAGIVFGHIGLRQEPTGRPLAIAGLIMSYLSLLLFIGAIVLFVIILGQAANEIDMDLSPSPSPTFPSPSVSHSGATA